MRRWYYGQSGSDYEDDNLSFTNNVKCITKKVLDDMDKTSKGRFISDKEKNDDMMLALKKPKHSGHTRGYVSLLWNLDLLRILTPTRDNKDAKVRRRTRCEILSMNLVEPPKLLFLKRFRDKWKLQLGS